MESRKGLEMGKYLIILISLTIAKPAYAEEHPIYNQILKNKKSINKVYAMKLSNIVHTVSKRVGVSARLLTALMAQESMYDNKAKGCVTGLDDLYQESRLCSDYSILQINHRTAKSYGIEIHRLMGDLEYSVESGARILKWFKITYGSDPDWFTRYNCGTRGTTKRDTCQIYKALVTRYL